MTKKIKIVPKVVVKMEKIGRAFIALWLTAQKANELGIAEPVMLYSTGIGDRVVRLRCLILRAGKDIVTIL